ANDEELEWATEIFEKNNFWCSNFLDLNDPMEGIFYCSSGEIIRKSYELKKAYKICSFCNKEAFENPAMWGYYANAFKGMAIKIKVDDSVVRIINYVNNISEVTNPITGSIEKILTTKYDSWKHEAEFRFMKKSEENRHKIGEIVGVYFGDPYGDVENKQEIKKDSESLRDYYGRKKKLEGIANNKGIEVHTVKIEGGKVQEVVRKKRSC
ncbi:MAG: hypothetical protein IID16_13350, partial [Candidatus Marinimicrobia bacterium]|nr:hypothetical protein [Candidatus Neomarinimicrobiota bacterium]